MIATGALAVVLLASALLVDPGAEAAFDAPKRFVLLIGVAVAAVAVLAGRRPAPARPRSVAGGVALGLALGGLAGVVVAAALSPRPAASLDATRVMLVGALLVPIGASSALAGRSGRILLGVFLAAAAANAVLSLLQAGYVFQPFPLESVSGRAATGALIGNEGQLALLLALAVVAALGVALAARRALTRAAAGTAVALFAAGLVENPSFTALAGALAGAAVLIAAVTGQRATVAAVAAVLAIGAVAPGHPAFRHRLDDAVAHARAGEWDDLTSNRLGPWAAALEMARERPMTGWGAGTFASEFVPHRLRAEVHLRSRFVIPRLTSSYAEAHSEYLQALAELGVPATLALVGAFATVLLGLARRVRGLPRAAGRESALLLALLVTGAVAALGWFPLHRPASAVPLLLAAGRAWRLLA